MQIDPVVVPQKTCISVSLRPVQSSFASLILLKKTDQYPGLNSWMIETFQSMTDEEKLNNKIALFGLFYCFLTDEDWPGVPEYLAELETWKPEVFRDNMIKRYAFNVLIEKSNGNPVLQKPISIDQDRIL